MALFRPFFILYTVSRHVSNSKGSVWNPVKKLTSVTTFGKIGFSPYLSVSIKIILGSPKYGNIPSPPPPHPPPVKNIEDTSLYHYNSLFVECFVYLISAFRRVLCLSFIRYCHSTTCYTVCYEWHEFHVASKILIFLPVIIYTSPRLYNSNCIFI